MIIKGRIWKEQVSISSDGVDNINIFYNIDDTVYIMDYVDIMDGNVYKTMSKVVWNPFGTHGNKQKIYHLNKSLKQKSISSRV